MFFKKLKLPLGHCPASAGAVIVAPPDPQAELNDLWPLNGILP